jgi:hypothetical protein
MKRSTITAGLSVAAAFTIGLAGCGADVSNKASAPSAGQSTLESEERAGHAQSAADMEIVKAELAKLSPEDAASAEKQHICPVSGELLGTMGPPKKIEVKEQQVWICCEGCREELLAQPDKYLAKLKKS